MRTQAVLDTLCRELQGNCGDILAAARVAGVSLMFIAQWRKDDKIADEALREAERVGVQGLVSAAIERGVNGVDEAVYFKGTVVGHKKVYSDGLLQTLLKAKVDDFKPDNDDGHRGVHVQVNLMPRAESYEQWLAMKDQTANRALPAPNTDDVIDAEYAEVPAFGGITL